MNTDPPKLSHDRLRTHSHTPLRHTSSQQRAPEDAIPDLPENRQAREFLKHAPSKGLWLPMGVAVKVMQCWRCKAYGHRTGDRECPLSAAGNLVLDAERQAREDPMAVPLSRHDQKLAKRAQLEALLQEAKDEAKAKKKRKKKKEKKKRRHRHESSSDSESRDSSSSITDSPRRHSSSRRRQSRSRSRSRDRR